MLCGFVVSDMRKYNRDKKIDWNRTETMVNDNAEPVFRRKHTIEHRGNGWPSTSAGISPYSKAQHEEIQRLLVITKHVWHFTGYSMWKVNLHILIYSINRTPCDQCCSNNRSLQIPNVPRHLRCRVRFLPSTRSTLPPSLVLIISDLWRHLLHKCRSADRYAENDCKTWDSGHIFFCVWHLVRTSWKTQTKEAFADLLTAMSLKSPRVQHSLQQTQGPHRSKIGTS